MLSREDVLEFIMLLETLRRLLLLLESLLRARCRSLVDLRRFVLVGGGGGVCGTMYAMVEQ